MTEVKDRWYFTKESLANTPSHRDGYTPERELFSRQLAAQFIQEMGQQLQVSQLCINTAIVYMHRFYVLHSFAKFDLYDIGKAALFLAAKVEEQPKKIESLLKVAHLCLHRDKSLTLNPESDEYEKMMNDLIENENFMLSTLGFDILIEHPHAHVIRCCELVKASKTLAKTAYFIATNSLHLTTMCLHYKPKVVACFSIDLACKWSNWEFPRSSEGKDWFSYVDPSISVDLLDQMTDEFLKIFEITSENLKMTISNPAVTLPTSVQGSSHEGYHFEEDRKLTEAKATKKLAVASNVQTMEREGHDKENIPWKLYPCEIPPVRCKQLYERHAEKIISHQRANVTTSHKGYSQQRPPHSGHQVLPPIKESGSGQVTKWKNHEVKLRNTKMPQHNLDPLFPVHENSKNHLNTTEIHDCTAQSYPLQELQLNQNVPCQQKRSGSDKYESAQPTSVIPILKDVVKDVSAKYDKFDSRQSLGTDYSGFSKQRLARDPKCEGYIHPGATVHHKKPAEKYRKLNENDSSLTSLMEKLLPFKEGPSKAPDQKHDGNAYGAKRKEWVSPALKPAKRYMQPPDAVPRGLFYAKVPADSELFSSQDPPIKIPKVEAGLKNKNMTYFVPATKIKSTTTPSIFSPENNVSSKDIVSSLFKNRNYVP